MKQQDIIVGGRYRAKVSGRIVTVEVKEIEEVEGRHLRSPIFPNLTRRIKARIRFHVVNLETGRQLVFRSAMRFRCKAVNAGGEK